MNIDANILNKIKENRIKQCMKLPGESHVQRSLACYSSWDHKSQTQHSN